MLLHVSGPRKHNTAPSLLLDASSAFRLLLRSSRRCFAVLLCISLVRTRRRCSTSFSYLKESRLAHLLRNSLISLTLANLLLHVVVNLQYLLVLALPFEVAVQLQVPGGVKNRTRELHD